MCTSLLTCVSVLALTDIVTIHISDFLGSSEFKHIFDNNLAISYYRKVGLVHAELKSANYIYFNVL